MAIPVVGQTVFNFEAYPMPRYWLLAADEVMLIQIQKNAFLLNWRKRDKEYPHFEIVKQQFDRYFGAFQSFLKSEFGLEEAPVRLTELTYTNVITAENGWNGVSAIDEVFPGLTIPVLPISGIQEPDINYVTAYRFANDLSMNLVVRTARNPVDIAKTALIFEFRTIGVLEDPTTADSWYGRAHDVISDCFTATTSPGIREKWQPE